MELFKDFVLFPLMMFFVIFTSVRVAISPMLNNGKRFGLFDQEHVKKMKVMGILNDEEIRKYYEVNIEESKLGRDVMDYRHFKEVLEILQEAGHITEMDYKKKKIKLNKFYSFE